METNNQYLETRPVGSLMCQYAIPCIIRQLNADETPFRPVDLIEGDHVIDRWLSEGHGLDGPLFQQSRGQRRVDLVTVVIEFLHQNAARPRPAGRRFDPRRDPRTEKTGRKQWNKAYLRMRRSRGKAALFSQNPAEDAPIESSTAPARSGWHRSGIGCRSGPHTPPDTGRTAGPAGHSR